MNEVRINWEPQPRQLVLLQAVGLDYPFTGNQLHLPIADMFGYGGSAGGGKTDTLLGVGLVASLVYPGINIGYFRREFPQLEGAGGAIPRSLQIIKPEIAKYNDQSHKWKFKTVGEKQSILQFCHCKNPKDVYNYQSQQFDIELIDESTQFTEEMIDYLVTRNRATVKYPTFKPFTVQATNPGNIGHGSFKVRFVELGTPETVKDFKYETGIIRKHFFVPSRLDDNAILVSRDPGYADRISTNDLNRRMLLEGDWDVFIGQAFSELRREKHLISPFEIPSWWYKFGAYDHGFNHPFSFGKFAADDDGNVYLYKRISDRLKRPDEIADMIGDVSDLKAIYAGHDCWNKGRGGEPTIAEQFRNTRNKLNLIRANISRVAGASQLRQYLAWKNTLKDKDGNLVDGKPKFYIFETESEVYDVLSRMIFDTTHPEDVLKVDADDIGKGGDDDYDMVRYGLMSRPRLGKKPGEKVDIRSGEYFLKLIETQERISRAQQSVL